MFMLDSGPGAAFGPHRGDVLGLDQHHEPLGRDLDRADGTLPADRLRRRIGRTSAHLDEDKHGEENPEPEE
jgi:hypothetical protein